MLGCYLEESGDTGAVLTATAPVQPLLCLLALAFDLSALRDITLGLIDLKGRFFPGLCQGRGRLGRILVEIKGRDIRAAFRSTSPSHRLRHTYVGFLDALLDLIDRYGGKIFGRVWVKPIGAQINGTAIYTSSAQAICTIFHQMLVTRNESGILIPDPRAKAQDRKVSFSIFTQKFKLTGDTYPRLFEMPVFGQSVNHAGIQICDLLCSGLLFPIASYSYCSGYVQNVHVDAGFGTLKARYATRLRSMQYSYYDPAAHAWQGGIVVSDPLGGRHSGYLLR